jgi:hypothetical protein
MNREDIDAMMRELPSQQPQETTWSKVWIGTWFIMFLILCIYAPDIRYQPTEESTHGYSQENTSQEGCRKGTSQGTRQESTREGGQTARGAVQT